jgi:Holliday junction DNA helicase RuvA
VGYEVAVPLSTFDKLVPQGERQRLWTHVSFSEDGTRLFGFATTAERDLFRLLMP